MDANVNPLGTVFPLFVRSDDDKVRWKACLDIVAVVYGMTFPKDIDLQQFMARAVYNGPVPTDQLRGASPDAPPSLTPDAPKRFGEETPENPAVQRTAMKTAGALKWEQDGDDFTTTINGAIVHVEGSQTPPTTVAARLAYLLSPLPEKAGEDVTVTLSQGPNPEDETDDPTIVTSNDGEVTFWNVGTTGAKLNEQIFDVVVARALLPTSTKTYEAAQKADQSAGQQFAMKYQKKNNASLSALIGPEFLVGGPEMSYFANGRGPEADFVEALAWWMKSVRHGGILKGGIKYADVYPNRAKAFATWTI